MHGGDHSARRSITTDREASARSALSNATHLRRPEARLRPTPAPDERLAAIGDVARDYGVTLRALRFYEDKGLIAPMRQGVTRLYRPEDRRRLAKILEGKKLGFTLERIRDLLANEGVAEPQLADATAILQSLSPQEIASQLSTLERQRAALDAAIDELRDTHAQMSRRLPSAVNA